jgi:hypothetical protein
MYCHLGRASTINPGYKVPAEQLIGFYWLVTSSENDYTLLFAGWVDDSSEQERKLKPPSL